MQLLFVDRCVACGISARVAQWSNFHATKSQACGTVTHRLYSYWWLTVACHLCRIAAFHYMTQALSKASIYFISSLVAYSWVQHENKVSNAPVVLPFSQRRRPTVTHFAPVPAIRKCMPAGAAWLGAASWQTFDDIGSKASFEGCLSLYSWAVSNCSIVIALIILLQMRP